MVQAAGRVGAVVRWADVDTATGELPVDQFDDLIGDRTRIVAVTAASNVIGTRPDLAAITAKAHAVGAHAYVDGVHATPHGPIDLASLGADFYATARTNGPVRISAQSSPTRLCWRLCGRTSWRHRATRCRGDSSGALPRLPTWPE